MVVAHSVNEDEVVGKTHRRTPESMSPWAPTGSWRPLWNRKKIFYICGDLDTPNPAAASTWAAPMFPIPSGSSILHQTSRFPTHSLLSAPHSLEFTTNIIYRITEWFCKVGRDLHQFQPSTTHQLNHSTHPVCFKHIQGW